MWVCNEKSILNSRKRQTIIIFYNKIRDYNECSETKYLLIFITKKEKKEKEIAILSNILSKVTKLIAFKISCTYEDFVF